MPLHPEAIPTSEQVRETLADRVYHPYKKHIWAGGTLLVLGVVGFLGLREVRRQREDAAWDRYYEATSKPLRNSFSGDADKTAARAQIEALRQLAGEYPDDTVTPFALKGLLDAQVAAGEYEEALATLGQIRTRFKDFALNVSPGLPDDGKARSLAAQLESSIRKEITWAKARAYEHHWPSDDRLALVETTAGSMWLGFYSAAGESPEHVKGFVKRAKDGFYNGTQVYQLRQDVDGAPQLIEAGSAASRPEKLGGVKDPAEHDRDEPTDVVEPEDGRYAIRHHYRVISAVVMPSGESGSRFMVIAKKEGLSRYDGENTPFAAVMDREKSLETLDRIARSPTYATNTETKASAGVFRVRDHPYPPIYIRRVTIWKEEKLEDGHTWDTSRASTDQPEPWEANLPPAPKPDEVGTSPPGGDQKAGAPAGGGK